MKMDSPSPRPLVRRRINEIKWKTPNYYETGHDINSYISGTLVTWTDQVCYAEYDHDSGAKIPRVLLYNPINHDRIGSVPATEIDITSFELGYFNLTRYDRSNPNKTEVYYARRHPYKKWKQGVCSSNTCVYEINGDPAHIDFFNNKGFLESLTGMYPTFEFASDYLKTVKNSIAISSEVALKSEDFGVCSVYFKTRGVGYIPLGEKKITIMENEMDWVVKKYFEELEWDIV